MYVADYGNNRIQVLNRNLTFSHMFGSHGSNEGQFNYPCGVTIDDNTGDVYVADYWNHRIQKFTSDGKFVSIFKTKAN